MGPASSGPAVLVAEEDMRTVLLKKNIIGGILMLGSLPAAWAGISACPASVEQTLSSTVVGTGQGCSYLNAQFINFNVSTATGANASFPATTGTNGGSNENTNIEFSPSGTPIYTLGFQTIATNIPAGPSSTAPCTAETWCVLENGATLTASQNINYGAVATTGAFYGLTLTDGTLQTHALIAGDIITTIEAFCLGISTFTCSTSGGTYGYIEIQQTENNTNNGFNTTYTVCAPGATTCVLQSSPTAAFNFLAKATSIGIQDTVTIFIPSGGTEPVFIDGFDNSFDTVPEPSTFILLGSALAGLGFLGARRKRA